MRWRAIELGNLLEVVEQFCSTDNAPQFIGENV